MSTNITPDNMIDLLSLMAVFDQREPGPEDVKGWLLIADLEGWDRDAVHRIVLDYYRSGADRPRLTPAAVTDRHRALRRAAASSFEDPVIPLDLPASDYPAWYRAQLNAHIDACMSRWAATGEEPRAIES